MSILTRIRNAGAALVAQADPAAASDEDGAGYRSSSVTLGQILDYMGGTGDTWPYGLYEPHLSYGRNTAVQFATLHRCISLIAGIAGQVITGGYIRVEDRDHKKDTSHKAKRMLELLNHSLDGRDPALQNIEDAMTDYLLEGNAILAIEKMNGRVERLRRMNSWSAQSMTTKSGREVYQVVSPSVPHGAIEWFGSMSICHTRWPFMRRQSLSQMGRSSFALAPVTALRPAVEIGMRGDQYIWSYFKEGAKPQLHIDYKIGPDEPPLDTKVKDEIREYTHNQIKKREPLITFNATSSAIMDAPARNEDPKHREYQGQECARFYGLPAPIIGFMVTQWGSGISELARLTWRTGVSQHVGRFLAPLAYRTLNPGSRFVVDVTELLRGDAQAVKEMIESIRGDAQRPGIGTMDEARHIAGLSREYEGKLLDGAPQKQKTALPSPADPPME